MSRDYDYVDVARKERAIKDRDWFAAKAVEFKQQRDDLVAACSALVTMAEGWTGGEHNPVIERAKAAILKAEAERG